MNEVKNEKKGIWITAIIAFILLITVGVIFNSMYKHEHRKQLTVIENQRKAFTTLVTVRDSIINESVLAFNEIEDNLDAITQKQNLVSVKSADKELTKSKKQQILSDIQTLNTLLDQNKKKIAFLSDQLKKSGVEIKGLQDRIAQLEATVKLHETEIADLKTILEKKNSEIIQLNTQVAEQQTAITQKDQTITGQTAELNKAFFTCGTVKDLKTKGVVTKEGGFLGLGKKEVLHFTDNLFTQVDVTQVKSIPVNSKNAKLVTNHPVGSYELIKDKNNKIASIEIKDAILFWKVSKYAVVETKN